MKLGSVTAEIFLKENGFDSDGRPEGEADPDQLQFETTIVVKGGVSIEALSAIDNGQFLGAVASAIMG